MVELRSPSWTIQVPVRKTNDTFVNIIFIITSISFGSGCCDVNSKKYY